MDVFPVGGTSRRGVIDKIKKYAGSQNEQVALLLKIGIYCFPGATIALCICNHTSNLYTSRTNVDPRCLPMAGLSWPVLSWWFRTLGYEDSIKTANFKRNVSFDVLAFLAQLRHEEVSETSESYDSFCCGTREYALSAYISYVV